MTPGSRASGASGRWVVVGVVLLRAATLPAAARAQGVFHLTPSVGAIQVYDTNLLSTPFDRQADFITRLSPGLETEYRSTPLTMLGRYTFDVERFADHPELTTLHARQHAALDVGIRPTRRQAVAFGIELSKTQTPGELNAQTGIAFTRADAQRLAIHPAVTRQLGATTVGTIDYTFTEDRLAGGMAVRVHAATATADRHLSPRDTVSAAYAFRQFLFSADSDATTSQVVSLGWAHAMTRQTSVEIHSGPRLSDGSVAPELSASIAYHRKPADLSLAYSRTQTTLIGLAGTADTHGVSAAVTYRARPAWQMRLAPGFLRTARAGVQADVYRFMLETERPIVRELSLVAAYGVDLQHGNVYPGRAHDRLSRQVVQLRLLASRPH